MSPFKIRPLIIGQAPSRDSDPASPFSGKSGAMLAEIIGISHGEFLDRFDRRNLFPTYPGRGSGKGDRWPQTLARKRAIEMIPSLDGRAAVILAGSNVAHAFGVAVRPLDWHFVNLDRASFSALVIPHPSGIVLWWNDPANRARASDVLRHIPGVRG